MLKSVDIQSYKKIFSIALPMILSAISIPMLGIVDTIILGHLEDAIYLAAINVGATIFNLLFWGFAFLKMSTTGLISQLFGKLKGNPEIQHKINKQLTQSLLIALLIAIVILVFQKLIGVVAIKLTAEGGDVAQLASEYFQVRIFSAPATLLIYVFFGYFLAIQKTKNVLLIMLVNQVGNMVLDYIFVVHFHWGIAGVAYGSIISEYLALILSLYFLVNSGFKLASFSQIQNWFTDTTDMKIFFSLNGNIFIRTLCLMAVFTMLTKGSAQLGELPLAANAVLLNFFYLMAYGLDGFAHAVESLCGQAYGEKNIKAFKQILANVFSISLVISILFSIIYLIFGQYIISLLTSIYAVQNYASAFIIWLVVIPVVSMPSFVYDGLFIATTEAKIMRNSMVIATVFCYIPLWYVLRRFDNHGLWAAFFIFFIVRSLTIHIYYRKWIRNWQQSINT